MYSFAHLIEFQQEKEEQIVSEPSFSPFQIISRGKKMFWVKFFLPPFPDSIQCLKGWLAIAKLKPLSLFISLNIIALESI